MHSTFRRYLSTALVVAAIVGLAVAPAGAVPVVGNAGFETDTYTVFPGYSSNPGNPGITAWTESGGTGINPGGGSPFANNGTIPEGSQVAFIQTSGTLSQSVSGFTAGNRYVVRLRTNARGGNTAQLEIDLGGTNVLPTTAVTAVGTTQAYRSATSGIFTAIDTTHVVALRNATVPDNTLLLDAVEIVDLGASGPVILNGGFEDAALNPSSFIKGPSVSDFHIGTWTFSGAGAGISRNVSAFQNGGLTASEGQQIGVLQEIASITQTIQGLVPGEAYTITLDNTRRSSTDANNLRVVVDGQTILGGKVQNTAFATNTSGAFIASGTTASLVLQATNPDGGDKTTFVDDVQITQLAAAASPALENASFEAGPLNVVPGYGLVDGWASNTSSSGHNDATGPFLNGKAIPDGARVAFIQGPGEMTQLIRGLTPGEAYNITVAAAERSAGAPNDLQVIVDGQTLASGLVAHDSLKDFGSAAFVASGTTAQITLKTTNPAGGDRTTVFDDVRINSLGVLTAPTLVNPGFEADSFTNAPGYVSTNGPVTGWIGTDDARVGINPGGGSPFADNGAIPEGTQVGFVQSNGSAESLSQTAVGLTPGERYVLIYRENARSTGTATAFASTTFDGSVIVPGHSVTPVGGANQYVPVVSVPFTATAASGALTFTNNTATDNTLLVDAVQFLQVNATGPVVVNPSFEFDTFTTNPGYISGAGNGQITGWASSGASTGINPGTTFSPFANNGTIPDGSQVAFLQANGTTTEISQTIHGFEPGENYIVTYRENTRSGQTVDATTTLGGTTVVGTHAATSVGGTNPYRYVGSDVFTASSTAHDLVFTASAGSDNTLLLDDVAIDRVYLHYGDNFNVVANSNDINPGANDEPNRQTGFFSPLTYTESAHSGSGGGAPNLSQVNNGEYPDALLLAAQTGANPTIVSPDKNFNDLMPGGEQYVVQVDVNPTNQGDLGSWAAVVIGSSSQLASVNTSDGVGLLIRGNGGYQVFDGTLANTLEASGNLLSDFGIVDSGFYDVRMNYFVPAFDDVTPGLVGIFVDDILIHSFTPDSGFANNYITLVGERDATALTTHGFDNLQVWSTFAVPEPGTGVLVLIAGMGLLTSARRRRGRGCRM